VAKSKSAGSSQKTSFGKRRVGKYKKSNGPKEAPTKKSVGQGK
jgi:hypothetical protein